ncbi:MAG: outer membrane lipoprotein-sorting protein [Sphaerochaeta sp.]|nr:outer membrane lipoprotein-sorting protein [Sphaerochaeta sp.]
MRFQKKLICAVLGVFFVLLPVFAIDGTTVMQQAHDVKKPEYTHSLVRMDLIEKNGNTQSRILEEWSQDTDGMTGAVVIFKSPASVKDTRFLQVEENGISNKWIYLPSLRSTRRIASSEGSKSFMGSDASYDDMTVRDVEEDVHVLQQESVEKNGYQCYMVKSTPVDQSSSQYLYRMVYVDKQTMIPICEELYDMQGSLLKVLTVEEIKKIAPYDIPLVNHLENVQSGHATRLVIGQIELDKPIPSKVFTQNFLNTGRI